MENTFQSDSFQLIIPSDLLDKMDRALIGEDDARRTVIHCEESGVKLLDTDTGEYVGHLKDGALTYWVRYKMELGTARLVSVYCHRAVITKVNAS